ncbi:alpha/beta hydrolase fold domain-containing protein [Microbacterium sp.]|uniref:alpha/beta hydrolase fold domain-containing protein n=1 Tax=Microbacterium sp. TaxID=51671 RepID=UPI002733D5BD|nr:alpha/beta hydrolase fold domain-containing protein [Microbacterium sp.]MDP3950646.1 alpha/beta hydrolase fold domain-containing protein [Microbacterium sp.]
MTSRGHEPSSQLAEMRRLMDENAAAPDSENVTVTVDHADDVEVWTFTPRDTTTHFALLHFHGGGYRLGSPRGFARYFARVAEALGTTIHAPKYRLAPDAAFPAALDDAESAYRWLLEKGVPADRIIVGGDSAGGGLAAALLLKIHDLGLARPGGGALFSPWLDLRVVSRSYDDNAESDRMFSREQANQATELYLQGHDASDPLASPLLGDWTGQPPLLIHVSDIEVLRDDSQLLAAHAGAAGVSVRLERFPDTQHVWHNAYPETPQSIAALDNWRDWLTRELVPLAPSAARAT